MIKLFVRLLTVCLLGVLSVPVSAANSSVQPLGVDPPVTVAASWRAVQPAAASSPEVGPVYRVVHVVNRYKGATQSVFAIPTPPAGVSYKRIKFAALKSTGKTWGILLRSDHKLIGYGTYGKNLVKKFYEQHPNAEVLDMESSGTWLILSDGSLASLFPPIDSFDTSTMTFPTGNAKLTGFFNGQMNLYVRADQRIWYHPTGFEEGNIDITDKLDDSSDPSYSRAVTADTIDNYVSGVVNSEPETTGCWSIRENVQDREGYIRLIRQDGRSELYEPDYFTQYMPSFSRWTIPGTNPNQRPLHGGEEPPSLVRGLKYISVAALDEYSVYLRSDGMLAYRGLSCKPSQPPKPPAGLSYVSVDAGFAGKIGIYRSDGDMVTLASVRPKDDNWYADNFPNAPLKPKVAKGWRHLDPPNFFSGNCPSGYCGIRDAKEKAVEHTFFVIEKITANQKVDSGIEVTKKSPTKSTIRLTAKVHSQAVLKGGKVVVKDYRGKTVGQATITKSAKVVISVKTSRLKHLKTAQKLSVQFLGCAQANPSGIAKTSVKVH
jgi:hypothetical protein